MVAMGYGRKRSIITVTWRNLQHPWDVRWRFWRLTLMNDPKMGPKSWWFQPRKIESDPRISWSVKMKQHGKFVGFATLWCLEPVSKILFQMVILKVMNPMVFDPKKITKQTNPEINSKFFPEIVDFCLLPPTFKQPQAIFQSKGTHCPNSSHHQEYQVPKMEESWTLQLVKVSTSILLTWNLWWSHSCFGPVEVHLHVMMPCAMTSQECAHQTVACWDDFSSIFCRTQTKSQHFLFQTKVRHFLFT